MALRELGFETVMVNCNPETVSTDYDTADRLYFEPLTLEDVLDIVDEEKPEGVIVQFGGQTPLKLAVPLEKRGVQPARHERRRHRPRRGPRPLRRAAHQARAQAPAQRHRHDGRGGARPIAERIGFPVLVRPSYVLGGRAMMIAYTREELEAFVARAVEAAREAGTQTILVDEFLKDAIEVDVDCVADGDALRHRRRDAAHRGGGRPLGRLAPASCRRTRSRPRSCSRIEEQSRMLALELGVVGPDERAVRGRRAARSTSSR